MIDALDATLYAILTAGPGWRSDPIPKEDTMSKQPTLTVEYFEPTPQLLATAHTDPNVASFSWKPATDSGVSSTGGLGWDAPFPDDPPTFGKHAAEKDRVAEATKKLLDDEDMKIQCKRWLIGDPIPGANEAISDALEHGAEAFKRILEDAGLSDGAVKAFEEALGKIESAFHVDFGLDSDAIKKLVGKSGLSDVLWAFTAATDTPAHAYSRVASESRKKRFDEFAAKADASALDKAEADLAARQQAEELQNAVLSPLMGLEANFADRVEALDGNVGAMYAAPLNPEALAEARTALAAVRRTIKAAKTVHPVYSTEQAAA